jgi:hypothetical protein
MKKEEREEEGEDAGRDGRGEEEDGEEDRHCADIVSLASCDAATLRLQKWSRTREVDWVRTLCSKTGRDCGLYKTTLTHGQRGPRREWR